MTLRFKWVERDRKKRKKKNDKLDKKKVTKKDKQKWLEYEREILKRR